MGAPKSSLLLDLRPGERLDLGEGVALVEVLHKSGRVVRLRLTAPKEFRVRKIPTIERLKEHEDAET